MSYPGYGAPNHGIGGYGPPPGPQGYRPAPQPPASQGSAIGALVANIIGLCLCTFLSLVGVVLAIVALTTTQSNPQASRICAIIAWCLFGFGAVVSITILAIWGMAFYYQLLGLEDPSYYDGY